ncbi:MAG: cupin domain-containing protein [Tissierellia bacterium]|nr:cupin domain-containing protein [Tissierellia bacterium]
MKNIFAELIFSKDREIVNNFFENQDIRVELITSSGQVSNWYDQDEDELVFLLEGMAIIEYEEGTETLEKGAFTFIPKHKKHRVAYTSENCIWLCIFNK